MTPLPIAKDCPVAQLELGDYLNFVYLVLDWETHRAAIVDPQQDVKTPLSLLQMHGFTLERILLTHTHFDHIAGLLELTKQYAGIPVHAHQDDLKRLSDLKYRDIGFVTLEDDEDFLTGKLRIRSLHTPGHSAGELCYWIEKAGSWLLTGDTIFIRDCGRTDLETGSTLQMFNTLQKIRKLPPETVILPGHHYQPECWSHLAIELRESPPFQCRGPEELEALP